MPSQHSWCPRVLEGILMGISLSYNLIYAQENVLTRGLSPGKSKSVAHALNDTFHTRLPLAIQQASLQLQLLARSGTHHLQVFVGQPAAPQTLIVDTGSRITALRCNGCLSCGRHTVTNNEQYYDPNNSSTSQVIKCGSCQYDSSFCSSDLSRCLIRQRYTEGSMWTAFQVTDFVSVHTGTLLATHQPGKSNWTDAYEISIPYTVPYLFGCQTMLSGLFRGQFADGILGLEAHSTDDGESYPNQLLHVLKRERVLNSSAFSLCLALHKGFMGLGGALIHRHLETMQWTPLRNKSTSSSVTSMYSVTVEQVWLADVCLASTDKQVEDFATGKGTILDSGTTDSFLPVAIAPAMAAAWTNLTGRDFLKRKQQYTKEEFELLPTLKIVMANQAILSIPAKHYMEGAHKVYRRTLKKVTKSLYELTNRLYVDEPFGAVLGINAMMNHDILFDWESGVIGIAVADCNSDLEIADTT